MHVSLCFLVKLKEGERERERSVRTEFALGTDCLELNDTTRMRKC